MFRICYNSGHFFIFPSHLLIIWAFSPGFPTLFNIVFPNRVENLYFTLYRTIAKITPFSCRNHYQVFHKGDGLFPC